MAVIPPIRLVDYFVERLEFEALTDEGDDLEPNERVPFHNIGFDVNYDEPDEEADAGEGAAEPSDEDRGEGERVAFRLTVRLNPGDDLPPAVCYRASVRLAALFDRQPRASLDPEPSEEEYQIHFMASALSTLYGSARELLATLSAPTPFPKLILPSVSPYAVARGMLSGRGQISPASE